MVSWAKQTHEFCQCRGCERSHCTLHCCLPSLFHAVKGNWTTLVPGLARSLRATTFLCIEFPGRFASLPVGLERFWLSSGTLGMVFSLPFSRSRLHPQRHLHHLHPLQHSSPPSSETVLGRLPHHTTPHNAMQYNATQHNNVTPQVMGRGTFHSSLLFHRRFDTCGRRRCRCFSTHLCAIASSSSPSCIAWCCCGHTDCHRTQVRRLETHRKALCRQPRAGSRRSSARVCSWTSWESRLRRPSEEEVRRIHGEDVSSVHEEGTGWRCAAQTHRTPSESNHQHISLCHEQERFCSPWK